MTSWVPLSLTNLLSGAGRRGSNASSSAGATSPPQQQQPLLETPAAQPSAAAAAAAEPAMQQQQQQQGAAARGGSSKPTPPAGTKRKRELQQLHQELMQIAGTLDVAVDLPRLRKRSKGDSSSERNSRENSAAAVSPPEAGGSGGAPGFFAAALKRAPPSAHSPAAAGGSGSGASPAGAQDAYELPPPRLCGTFALQLGGTAAAASPAGSKQASQGRQQQQPRNWGPKNDSCHLWAWLCTLQMQHLYPQAGRQPLTKEQQQQLQWADRQQAAAQQLPVNGSTKRRRSQQGMWSDEDDDGMFAGDSAAAVAALASLTASAPPEALAALAAFAEGATGGAAAAAGSGGGSHYRGSGSSGKPAQRRAAAAGAAATAAMAALHAAADSDDSGDVLVDLLREPAWPAAGGRQQQQQHRQQQPLGRLLGGSSGNSKGAQQFVRLNRVDAKLESIRRAAFVLGRTPSMSAEMAAPRAAAAAAARKPPKVPSPPRVAGSGAGGGAGFQFGGRRASSSSSGGGAAAASGSASKSTSSRKASPSSSKGRLPRLPSTNTFSAASDVKAMSKLDSLLRAKEAAAAIKAAVQSGHPYEGTLEQRHHSLQQQLRQQLPDGRVPCAESLAVLQEVLSGQLPGIRLDSEWLVYPATPQDAVPKLDILIRHPRITLGHFRSYKSVATFYSSLTSLIRASKSSSSFYIGKELAVPGLSLLPDSLRQLASKAGRSPGEVQALMLKAASTVGRSLVRLDAPQTGSAAAAAGAALAAGDDRSSADSDGGGSAGLYPVGGVRAAAANAVAVAARRWQPPPLVTNLQQPRKGSPVLVLGMFYASEATAMESHNGLAQYRDRMRLAALHKQVGYVPLSFDRDHEVDLAQLGATEEGGADARLHVQGNFNSKRGAAAVANRFPDTRFSAVFCDYFRMPSGYAGDIYKAQLFHDFIPELVRRGNLPAGVPIYIPNSPVLLEQLAASGAFRDYGDVVAVPAHSYPLHEATRHAEVAGLMPAKYSNEGQVRELVPGAEFIVVHYCGDATPPPPPAAAATSLPAAAAGGGAGAARGAGGGAAAAAEGSSGGA